MSTETIPQPHWSTSIAVSTSRIGNGEIPAVDGRDLHAFLGSRAKFANWAKTQIDRCRLVDGIDYLRSTRITQLPSGSKTSVEYTFGLEAAKHIGMMSGTDRGFEVRNYFIGIEKKFLEESSNLSSALQNPATLKNLLLGYSSQVVALESENKGLRSRADAHAELTEASNCQTVQETAKVLGTGPNRLFKFLRSERILLKDNLPAQAHLEAGRFRVVQRSFKNSHGVSEIYTVTLVTGKGLAFIQRRLHERAVVGSESAGQAVGN